MIQIGKGILAWNGSERRSQRDGNIHLGAKTFKEDVCTDFHLNLPLGKYENRKVALYCKVLESRPSGHIGDMFLDIQPTQPQVGELIPLGVGILRVGLVAAWDSSVTASVGIEPEDGRDTLWIDPRILYRLHDQTVGLAVELTDAPCHPVPDIQPTAQGAKSCGGGSIQVCHRDLTEGMRIAPRIESLGDGMFSVSHAFNRGEDVTLRQGEPDADN